MLEIPHAWSDDELYDFCIANRNLFIERNSEGQIIIMAPAGGKSSNFSLKIATAIEIWNQRNDNFGIAFDSSAGFRLKDGSMRSPDAAWVTKQAWEALTEDQKEKFPPLCPTFIAEVRSPSDRLPTLLHKMDEWVNNGCKLAWLIDPNEQKAYIYRPQKDTLILDGLTQQLSGYDILSDFRFDLSKLRA